MVKRPIGRSGRRSISVRSSHTITRATSNTGRQPSLSANGAMRRSTQPRMPSSVLKWLTISTSPPGRHTRASSRITFSGSGTTVITYMATTVSNEPSGNLRSPASISCRPVTLASPSAATPLARLLQHFGRQVEADDPQAAPVARQRQAGADADLQHPALARIDDLHGVLAPLGRDPPEGVVVNRAQRR